MCKCKSSPWEIKTYDVRKIILVGEEGDVVTVDVDQDNIQQIKAYFDKVEEDMNG